MAIATFSQWLRRPYAGLLRALALLGRSPRRPVRLPPPDQSGEPQLGRQIFGGNLTCAGRVFDTRQPLWFDPDADPAQLGALHSFRYLADLAAIGESGHQCARGLVSSWLKDADHLHKISWAPDVLGLRIAAWLTRLPMLLHGDDAALEPRILESLAGQVQHLTRNVRSGRCGLPRLDALKGLIYAAGCGIGGRRLLAHGLAHLRREIAAQIDQDGVHAERSPLTQYRALTALVDIRAMLEIAGAGIPQELSLAISRMAPMLRFFRHGDGGLALFNGSTEGSPAQIDALLARANAKGAPLSEAARSGFQRLSADSLLLIQDTGKPSAPGFDANAHAGTLSFEMSCGRERMIVNCGAARHSIGLALRATAAHSTLIIEDVNSAEIKADGTGHRPANMESVREEMNGNVWLTASHDGYADRFALIHRRRLYLAINGDNLRGEEALIPAAPSKGEGRNFAVRFHLHPAVRASLIHNGAAVLLRMPAGVGWRFQCSGGVPRLEESIYFPDGQTSRRSQQIVITGMTHRSGAVVKWAFQRIGDGQAAP